MNIIPPIGLWPFTIEVHGSGHGVQHVTVLASSAGAAVAEAEKTVRTNLNLPASFTLIGVTTTGGNI